MNECTNECVKFCWLEIQDVVDGQRRKGENLFLFLVLEVLF